MADQPSSTAAKKSKKKGGGNLLKPIWDRMTRHKSPTTPGSSNPNRGPIESAPGAHDPGLGKDAGSTEPTVSGGNAILNQNSTVPPLSARPSSSSVPDGVGYAVDQGHGGETGRILTPTPSISTSVSPTPGISGNTAEGRQKAHVAIDTSPTITPRLLVDGPQVFLSPVSHQDFVASSDSATLQISSPSDFSVLSPAAHHAGIEGESYASQPARPLDSVGPIATAGDGREASLGRSPTFPDAVSADRRVQDSDWKSTAKDVLEVAWTGMEMLLKKVEGCLDGTPAKAPVAAINALIDIKNAVGDNKGAIEELIIQTAERLLAVNMAMDQGVPESGKSRMTDFVGTLRVEIQKLKIMSAKGKFRRVLENDADKKAIEDRFKRIDEATKTFHLDIALTTERKVHDIHSEIKLTKLDRLLAYKAIYNADLGGGATVTRESCTEGTREEIRKDIIAWADDISAGSPPVFWLTGDAGSGKTTIAYTIAQHFDKLEKTEHTGRHTVLGGSFHCSRQFEETRRQIHIIPTLVYQLSRKSRSYAHALHEADKFDSVDKLDKQMEDLLTGPWQQSASRRHPELPPYLIIVDALDEIEIEVQGQVQGGSKFLHDILKTIKQHHLQGLKFLFTSRPDPSVTERFEPFPSKAVYRLQDVSIEHVGTDIIKYLQNKLPNFTNKTELEDMAQLADGLFISAATIVRYLTPDSSIQLEEQRMLLRRLRQRVKERQRDEERQSDEESFAESGLLIDQLYQQILYDAFSSFPKSLFDSRLCILHTFLCTFERTSTSVTAALLSKHDTTVAAVLKKLHAVLYSKEGQVLWYHASFPDFIFSKTRSKFEFKGRQFSMSCNVAQHHALLTKSCFEIMKKSLRFNIGDIPSSFVLDVEDLELKQRVDTNIKPFLRYASWHWAHHLSTADQENGMDLGGCITDFLHIRILFWIEAMNLLGASGQCSTMLQHAREWVLKNINRESELAANVAEAANFATYFTANPPALSTPHLYISALATWPTGSAISQQWKETFPGIPSFIHRKASDVPLMGILTGAFVLSAAFSTDGTRIISGSNDGSVRVWDASTRAELKVLNGHTDQVNSAAFSTDGTRIVSGSNDGSVRVWDASTGAELKVLNGHTKPVSSTAFSAKDTYIVSGSWDESVRLWDASTGAELKVLNGHTHGVNSAAFSTDGARIVSGSKDESVRVWDASTGAELKVLNGHKDQVNSAAFSTDGTRIVSGSWDGSVRVWDASTGAELQVLNGHKERVLSAAFSTDGTRIVSGSDDRSVRVWDASTGAELKVLNGHTDQVNSAVFSTDGTRIVSGSRDESVRVWDASTGADLQVLNGHTDRVLSATFSTDGTRIVSGSDDESVRVWDASTGAELQVLNGHTDRVNCAAFSTDGTRIVSGSWDGSVRVWDASTGAELKVLNGHRDRVLSTAFSNDGTHIVSGSDDESVRVWHASTGAELQVLNGHTDSVNCAAFSTDGTRIVSGSWDESVRVWDASTWVELQVLNGHTDRVNSAAFSTDGTHIVSGSDDKSVRVWHASTGAELQVLNGHTDRVNSAAFSTDGTHIVSGSWDGSVRVWDASTGAELKVLKGHMYGVISAAFSTDGTRIVSGSWDESVRVWDASTSSIDSACIPAQDEESARLSIVGHAYPAWTTNPNQWIFSALGGYRLMWVPEVAYPFSIIVISCQGSALIDFCDCTIGRDWANCYSHS